MYVKSTLLVFTFFSLLFLFFFCGSATITTRKWFDNLRQPKLLAQRDIRAILTTQPFLRTYLKLGRSNRSIRLRNAMEEKPLNVQKVGVEMVETYEARLPIRKSHTCSYLPFLSVRRHCTLSSLIFTRWIASDYH